MREIKFRAWHEQGKEMVYFKNEKLVNDQYQIQHLAHLINGDYGDVLMQHTGLKDKNGVEIYQRDICLVEGLGNCEVDICSFYGAVFKKNGCEYPVVDSIAEDDLFEVIGNIYENPELLESK